MTDLRTRAQALLEKLKGHGRAQVCTLEPSDCREAAAVLTELMSGYAAMDRAQAEATTLRVANKFLREKVGYFRDDIEDALAGRDGSTGIFALPRSGSTPEGARLDPNGKNKNWRKP